MTHTNTEALSDAKLNEMLAGLKGVTPGPWHEGDHWVFVPPASGIATQALENILSHDKPQANAAHIARCDPDTIRYLVTQELSRRAANSAGRVEVKALEWERVTKPGSEDEHDEAETPFGGYIITADAFSYSPTTAYYVDGPNWFKGQYASVVEAKAAAQADFNQRILSAIVSSPVSAEVTEAARDVLAERQRQVETEGWTPKHDDEHQHGEMAGAAACYALRNVQHWGAAQAAASLWPWDEKWWKPSDNRRNLVKAGALIIAEIERIDRLAALNGGRENG